MTDTYQPPWSKRGVRRFASRGNPDGLVIAAAAPETAVPQTDRVLNDGEMAWRLVAMVTDRVSLENRSRIYLLLGCGDHYEAIVDMLKEVRVGRIQLTAEVEGQIAVWFAGYRGSSVESSLRALAEFA